MKRTKVNRAIPKMGIPRQPSIVSGEEDAMMPDRPTRAAIRRKLYIRQIQGCSTGLLGPGCATITGCENASTIANCPTGAEVSGKM
jgi:hypothetical protein